MKRRHVDDVPPLLFPDFFAIQVGYKEPSFFVTWKKFKLTSIRIIVDVTKRIEIAKCRRHR